MNLPNDILTSPVDQDHSEMELTDDDILDAMQHLSGCVDISTADFRTSYHLARLHAVSRPFAGIRAAGLMRTGVATLRSQEIRF